MKRVHALSGIAMLAMTIMLLSAVPAVADEPVLVDRRVETVSGAQLARDIVTSVTDVDLGSDGATVTLNVDGEDKSINLNVGSLGGKGAVGGIFGIAALSGVAATSMKLIGRLARLFH